MAKGGTMDWTCSDWSATNDHQPIGPVTLRVIGECEMPTPGFRCELKKHQSQGISREDLLLDLVIAEPTGGQPEVITPCSVRFELETETEYKTVSIVDGAHGIPVEEVY